MRTISKAAIATFGALGLLGCVPGPAYIATKVSCSDASLAFGSLSLDGSSGFTDLSGRISEETAIRMLAERRVKFVEQKKLSTVSGPPLDLLVKMGKNDAFAKIWIDKIGSSACIVNNEHIHFGVTYDLFIQGMAPTECLAGEVVTQASGRYELDARYDDAMGVLHHEYVVRDRATGGKVAAIQGATMKVSNAAAKSPFPSGPTAACHANAQTVANLFSGSQGSLNRVPDLRHIDTARPISGEIKFTRTQLSREEFLKVASDTSAFDVTVASKGQNSIERKAILMGDGHFIGHYGFIGGRPRPAPKGVLFLGTGGVTFIWRTGEVQNLSITSDEGKFVMTDGYSTLGDKLLVFAVTDWKKGWGVYEAKLKDFDINVARRAIAEVTRIDESIK